MQRSDIDARSDIRRYSIARTLIHRLSPTFGSQFTDTENVKV